MTQSTGGERLWPATPYELADAHRCPSCFTVVSRLVCPTCGLTLSDPRAARLLELGQGILASELERQELIADIRATAASVAAASAAARSAAVERFAEARAQDTVTDAAPAPLADRAPDAAASVPASPSVDVAPPSPAPVRTPAPARSSAPVRPAVEAAPLAPPRRRLTVPVLLLIVGVSLVGVAAVFFVLLAWFVAGIAVRALIIGAVTLATIGVASWLRGKIPATAEGIAALGVVLLGLDAWAARANDLFGAGASDPAVYAGVAALVIAVLCRVWSRFSGLRVPDLASALALPAGIGLVVGGLVNLPAPQAIAAGLLGASAGGLVHALPAPWSAARPPRDAVAERLTLSVAGIAALIAAAAVGAFATDGIPAVLWIGAAVSVLGVAHTVALRRRAGLDELPWSIVLRGVSASLAAASAATLGWQLAARDDAPVLGALVAPVLAVAVAVVLDRLRTRSSDLVPAAVTAGAVGVLSLLGTAGSGLVTAAQRIEDTWMPWRMDSFAAPVPEALFALGAALLIAVGLFFAPALEQPILRQIRPAVAAMLVLIAAAQTAVPAILVGTGLIVAIAGVVALLRTTARSGWIGASALGAAVAFVAGTTTTWLWVTAVVAAIAVPIAQRIILRPTGPAAVTLALAPVGVAVVAAFIAPAALAASIDVYPAVSPAWALLQWIALVTLVVAASVRLDAQSRTPLAHAGALVLATALIGSILPGASGLSATSVLIGEPVAGIVRGILLVAVLIFIATGRTAVASPASWGAALLLAPTAVFTTHAVIETVAFADADRLGLWHVSVAVAVVWAATLWALRSRKTTARSIRAAVDIGALIAVAVAAWAVPSELRGTLLVIVGVGLAAASVTRGWAAPATGTTDGFPTTRAPGVHLGLAPRRLLAWPAFGFATLGAWAWIADTWPLASIEAFVIAPAVALLVFAALLLWLRRRTEATVATTLGLAVGLVVPAAVSASVPSTRGVVIALVSAGVVIALGWSPARRIVPVAVAGVATAVVALAIATTGLAWLEPPVASLWSALLVAVAIAGSWGLVSGAAVPGAEVSGDAVPGAGFVRRGVAASVLASIAPPAALVVAASTSMPTAAWHDSPNLFATLFAVALGLHVASAAWHRAPLGVVLRWMALFVAVCAAGVAVISGLVAEVEYVSLSIAAALLAGAALRGAVGGRPAQASGAVHASGAVRTGLETERVAWMLGVVAAVAPSLFAPAEPLRIWVLIAASVVAALALLLAPIADTARVRVASAVVLAAAALTMGARALGGGSDALPELAAIAAGVGAVLIAAAIVRVGPRDHAGPVAPFVAAAGAVLVIVTVAFRLDGALVTSAIATIGAGVVGVAGAFLIGLRRWAGFGAVVAVSGLVTAVLAVGVRISVLSAADAEPDVWALVGLGIVAAVIIAALRSSAARPVGLVAAGLASAALVAFAAVEQHLILLSGWSAGPAATTGRAILTMSILSIAGLIGWVRRDRFERVLVVSAAVIAALFALVVFTVGGVRPIEAVTVAPAIVGAAWGAWMLRTHPSARSWPMLGPWLVLLTVPSLLHDFSGDARLWRIVALGVVAIGLVIVGAVTKLQAPLVLGSAVLLIHGIAQLWPWIAAAYIAVWWLWLGLGGAALIFLAARYEKRMRALKTAYTAVRSLR